MKDIRQSPQYVGFMRDIGWETEKIKTYYIYLRRFPIFGYFAKLPRITPPFPFKELKKIMELKHIFLFRISPFVYISDRNYQEYKKQFKINGYKIDMFPFNTTTNIQVDLTRKENQIFDSFSEAKRRGVRRAIKNGIFVKETDDLETFIKIRKNQYKPLGFLIAPEMKKVWKNFHPKNASLLIAYQNNRTNEAVAGILLLFYDKIAYYWYASALKKGKKLFAPTLLVWEAIKNAKSHGCKILDFEGIYDERFPKAAESWKGFTKFKEGFYDKKIVYMENFQRKDLLNFIR